MKAYNKLKRGYIKNWYRENSIYKIHNLTIHFNDLIQMFEKEGYVFDPELGILIKRPFPQQILDQMGFTLMEVVFPRPFDLHYHPNLNKAFQVLQGNGVIHLQNGHGFYEKILHNPVTEFIPRNTMHAFSPDKGKWIKARLAFSGIFNKQEEVINHRFDFYWNNQFSQNSIP